MGKAIVFLAKESLENWNINLFEQMSVSVALDERSQYAPLTYFMKR